MAITIQKSTLGTYFTIQQPGDVARPYIVNDYNLVPAGDSINLSLIHKLSIKDNYQIILNNQPYTNVINGDTGSVFTDYTSYQNYILTNFFRKASGGAGSAARIGIITSSSTPTPAGDTNDQFNVTALAVGATFAAPTGTPTDGQSLIIRIKDNATSQTLAWNSIYRASTDFALPTATVISKTIYVQFVYNAADSKWDCTGLTSGF